MVTDRNGLMACHPYMSAHVLLNLLNEFGKKASYRFSPMSFINSVI